MNLFGRSRAAPAPGTGQDTTAAIKSVREALENLGKREEHLKRKVDQAQADALQYAKKHHDAPNDKSAKRGARFS